MDTDVSSKTKRRKLERNNFKILLMVTFLQDGDSGTSRGHRH